MNTQGTVDIHIGCSFMQADKEGQKAHTGLWRKLEDKEGDLKE